MCIRDRDYWKDLDVTTYVDWEDFLERNPGAKIDYATTKGRHVYLSLIHISCIQGKKTDTCHSTSGQTAKGADG